MIRAAFAFVVTAFKTAVAVFVWVIVVCCVLTKNR